MHCLPPILSPKASLWCCAEELGEAWCRLALMPFEQMPVEPQGHRVSKHSAYTVKNLLADLGGSILHLRGRSISPGNPSNEVFA